MEEPINITSWDKLKKLREEKGVSLFTLSEKMRLPQERIEYLEAGDFSDADPVITKLQIKNYCKQLDLDYEEIILLSGLKEPPTDIPAAPLGESVKIKKTRSYRGRKKEPSKLLIYTLIVAGVVGGIFLLNLIASNLNITSDAFEMTEDQVNALDTPTETKDTTSFKPVLPQTTKEDVVTDVLEDMSLYYSKSVTFPLKIDIFPKETISYRHETDGLNPREDFIMKDTPKSLFFTRPGRMIFYHTENSRFVASGFSFREENVSRIVFVVTEDRELKIFTK
jgi:transcriptional regulator with XRE-family HTH domain